MRILLLTTHLYQSKHRAGFHNLAQSLVHLGHEVCFCSVPNSFLNLVRDLFREPYKFILRLNTCGYAFWPKVITSVLVTSYVSWAYNYSHSNFLSEVKKRLFLWGYSRVFLRNRFDLIIFESSVSLFLLDRLKALNPHAKVVYRVSDPLVVMQADPCLLEHEKKSLSQFDLVSVPNERLAALISAIDSQVKPRVLPHGVDKTLLSQAKLSVSPYRNPSGKETSKNLLFIGMFLFDQGFLEIASRIRPDCTFHLIGFIPTTLRRANIQYYGVLPFQSTLPFIAHCDVALLTRRVSEHPEAMAKSLKFVQYTYFSKPILAPQEMDLKLPYVFSYELSEESVARAIENALHFETSNIDTSQIMDWTEVTEKLLSDIGNT